jgi:hypothetical protein
MYPATYFGLFPAFPRDDRVFVAMSFDRRFTRRWKTVIEPAVAECTYEDRKLKAYRVDARQVSDSILTDILQGISQSRLVLADISTVRRVGRRFFRNANVMYELGLAHAVRLPEEVLVFRSDHDALPFDTANVRVNPYAPDEEPEQARGTIQGCVADALREIDLRRAMTVKQIAESLDFDSWTMLFLAERPEGFVVGGQKRDHNFVTLSHQIAISRLLDLGAIQIEYPSTLIRSPELRKMREQFVYRITALGREALRCTREGIRFLDASDGQADRENNAPST